MASTVRVRALRRRRGQMAHPHLAGDQGGEFQAGPMADGEDVSRQISHERRDLLAALFGKYQRRQETCIEVDHASPRLQALVPVFAQRLDTGSVQAGQGRAEGGEIVQGECGLPARSGEHVSHRAAVTGDDDLLAGLHPIQKRAQMRLGVREVHRIMSRLFVTRNLVISRRDSPCCPAGLCRGRRAPTRSRLAPAAPGPNVSTQPTSLNAIAGPCPGHPFGDHGGSAASRAATAEPAFMGYRDVRPGIDGRVYKQWELRRYNVSSAAGP